MCVFIVLTVLVVPDGSCFCPFFLFSVLFQVATNYAIMSGLRQPGAHRSCEARCRAAAVCCDVCWSIEQQMTGRKKAVNATTKTQLNFGLLLRILECCCLAFHRAIDFFTLYYYECYARRHRTKFSASKSSKSRKRADASTTVGTQTFGRLH